MKGTKCGKTTKNQKLQRKRLQVIILTMNPTDIQICRDVITALRSDKYKNTNYLFQEAVDVKIFPTYTQLVKQPMDLGTAATNLENNSYDRKENFFADVALCFDNTKAFHEHNPDNAWIILMGDQMNKFLDKEIKRAEKKYSGGGDSGKKPKLKLSLMNKGSGKKNPKAAASKHPANSASSKIKFSLKAKPAAVTSVGALAPGPASDHESQSSAWPTPILAGSSIVQTPAAAKIKKPKIKLKLSSKKSVPTPIDTSSSMINIAATTPKASSTASTKKSSSKKESTKKSASIQKSIASASSRGKELPAAVAEKKAANKAESKKTHSTKKAGAVSAVPKTSALKISTKTVSSKHSSGQIKIKMKNTPRSSSPSPKKIKLTLGGPEKIQLGDGTMNPNIKAQCYKVISALKRKQHLEIKWFLKPVYDPIVIDDYKAKIKNPMDLSTLTSK